MLNEVGMEFVVRGLGIYRRAPSRRFPLLSRVRRRAHTHVIISNCNGNLRDGARR